jgi:hypothetical protein
MYDVRIQGVSEIRVLILTSGRTHQFMKVFSITFCKIRKNFPRFFWPPIFTKRVILCDQLISVHVGMNINGVNDLTCYLLL